MKMYEANTSEKVLEQIQELESVLDNLDTTISTLKKLDRSYFRGDITDLENQYKSIEEEIQGLGEEYEEKLNEEQRQYDNEVKAMNYEFERSRI